MIKATFKFLKNIISISIFSCTAIVLLAATNVEAAHNRTLTINSATWDGSTLTVAGKGERNVQVTVENAASPFQALGSDTPANNGNWSVSNSDASSATVCRVHAEQDDGVEVGIAELNVTGNPFCDNPPPQNEPPICTIDSPVADVVIFEGETVDYAGTAEDIDGVIQGFSWTFEGGFPQTSTAEAPGLVTTTRRVPTTRRLMLPMMMAQAVRLRLLVPLRYRLSVDLNRCPTRPTSR